MTTSQPTSTASTVVRGILGCGGLLLAGFTIIAVAAVVIRDESTVKPPAPPHSAGASTITASIEEYRSSLAAIVRGTMTKKDAEDGVRYSWKSASSSNWAQLWDDAGDGTIDDVMVGVVLPNNNEAKVLEALAVAHAIVETAGGVAVRGSDFSDWVSGSMKASASKTQERRFGAATVSFGALGASDGVVLTFSIDGEKGK